MTGSPFWPGFWSLTAPVNSTSPVLFSPMREASLAAGAAVEHDEADEEAGHAVEVALRPALEGVVVAAGTLQLRAQEDAADRDGRLLRLVAELDVEQLRARPARPGAGRAPSGRRARSWRTCRSSHFLKPSRRLVASALGGLRPNSTRSQTSACCVGEARVGEQPVDQLLALASASACRRGTARASSSVGMVPTRSR